MAELNTPVDLDLCTFRPARGADFDGILELTQTEYWFILKRSQLDVIINQLPVSFYVIVDGDEKVLGTACVCKTRGTEAMLGNVIIRRGHRGHGLGTMIITKALQFHKDTTVTWFSMADDFYKKLGYEQYNSQHGFFCEMLVHREKLDAYCKESKNLLSEDVNLIALSSEKEEDWIRYDTEARGYENRTFMKCLPKLTDEVFLAVKGSDQRIVGYVGVYNEPIGRLFFNGFYADDDSIAAALFRKVLASFPTVDTLRFFTLHSRQFLVQFGEATMVSKQSRFTTGPPPADIPERKLYTLPQVDLSY